MTISVEQIVQAQDEGGKILNEARNKQHAIMCLAAMMRRIGGQHCIKDDPDVIWRPDRKQRQAALFFLGHQTIYVNPKTTP